MKMSKLAVRLLVIGVLATMAHTVWGEVIVRVSPKEHVKDLKKVGKEIWIATDNGVSRLEGHSAKAVLTGLLALTIADVHGEVWAGTQDGVYRYQDGKMERLVAEEEGNVFVNAILVVDNTVWLGARQGLYYLDSTDPKSFRDAFLRPVVNEGRAIEGVLDIKTVATSTGGSTWVAAAGNVFQVDITGSSSAALGSDIDGYVSEIIEIGDSMWLTTMSSSESYDVAFRIRQNGDVEKIGGIVSSVAKVRDDVWLATNKGVFIYREGGAPEGPIDGKGEAFNAIAVAGETVWLGTRRNIYRNSSGSSFEIFPEYGNFNVKRIVAIDEDLWFQTTSGVLRLDEDVVITAQLPILAPLVLGEQVEIRSIRYNRDGMDPYSGELIPHFEAILQSDLETFKSAVEDERYGVYQGLRVGVRFFDELHLKARDSFGNSRSFSWRVLAVPMGAVWIVAIWAFLMVIFAVAPRFNFGMFILMQSFLRIAGSAFIVPLLLYFGRCRRYLLSRYRRALLEDDSFASCGHLLKLDLGAEFSGGTRFLIIDDDAGSLLKGLVRRVVKESVAPFGRRMPILLPLRLHANAPDGVALGLARRLKSFGRISDLRLGKWLVGRCQDFVYMFDGWDEIDGDQRLEVERFIDELSSDGMVVVGASSEVNPLIGFKIVKGEQIRRFSHGHPLARPVPDDISNSDSGNR